MNCIAKFCSILKKIDWSLNALFGNTKKVIKNIKTKVEKKPKKVVSFDDHIKVVIAKLLDKYKVDGIYTQKIIDMITDKLWALRLWY